LAIPAHVFVKIDRYWAIAKESRLRNSPAASAAGGRFTARKEDVPEVFRTSSPWRPRTI
jgi:hypothetical protein